MFIIKDWANNIKFDGMEFNSFEDAEEFLCQYFDAKGKEYDDCRDEYEITQKRK